MENKQLFEWRLTYALAMMPKGSLQSRTDLKRQVVLLPDIASELDDTLHALHLSLNVWVEVFFLHLREADEMDRSSITSRRILRDIGSQRLVEVLG